MNARTAARELALIVFSQIGDKLKEIKNKEIEEIILSSVRTISSEAENNLNITASSLLEIKEYIENYEADHSINLERPIGMEDIPVKVPMTSDMIGRINTLIDVCEKASIAFEINELTSLHATKEVKEFSHNIISKYSENKTAIDDEIQACSKGWDIDRLAKIDKNILRIAVTELLYTPETPIKVAIDEAIELAKKYSDEESPSFINGILRNVSDKHELENRK